MQALDIALVSSGREVIDDEQAILRYEGNLFESVPSTRPGRRHAPGAQPGTKVLLRQGGGLTDAGWAD